MLIYSRFELLTLTPEIVISETFFGSTITKHLGNGIQEYASTYVMYKINGNDLNMEENREIHITD